MSGQHNGHGHRFTSWGQALASVRSKRNLSHADVVRTIVGTNREDVRAWERNESVPTRYQLRGLYKMMPQLQYFTELLPRETIRSLEAADVLAASQAAVVMGRAKLDTAGVLSSDVSVEALGKASRDTIDELTSVARQSWIPPRADPRTAPKGEIDPTPLVTFGDHVRAARLRAGLTQEEFGELVDVVQSSVSQWEQNVSIPAGASLRRLREVFPELPDPEGTVRKGDKPVGNRYGNPGNVGNRSGSRPIDAWRMRVREALEKARTDRTIEGALRAAISELVEAGLSAATLMAAINDAIKFADTVRRSLPVHVAEHERAMPGARPEADAAATSTPTTSSTPPPPPPTPIVIPDLPGIAGAGVRYAAAVQAREHETRIRVDAERRFEEAKMAEEIAQEEVTKAHAALMTAAQEGAP